MNPALPKSEAQYRGVGSKAEPQEIPVVKEPDELHPSQTPSQPARPRWHAPSPHAQSRSMPITTRHEWLTPPTINKYYALDLAPDRSQQHEIRRDPHIVLGNHLSQCQMRYRADVSRFTRDPSIFSWPSLRKHSSTIPTLPAR
jgi:hypothetical protein